MKKTPERFTLKFNIGDPLQKAAVEVLERQGRHKAQFLANAILYYNANAIGDGPPKLLNIDDTVLEQRIRSILMSSRAGEGTQKVKTEEPDGQRCDQVCEAEKDLDELFSHAEIPAVYETLAAFLPK